MKKKITYLLCLVVCLSACSDSGSSSAPVSPSSSAAPNVGLEAKLTARFDAYRALRDSFIQGRRQSQPLSRQQLTQQLMVRDPTPWTDADTQELLASQQQRIQEARRSSQAASLINLDLIRIEGSESIRNFCENMPKGGMLHVHLMGTLGAETIHQILMSSSQLSFNDQTFRLHPDYQPRGLGRDLIPYINLNEHQRLNAVLPYYRLSNDRVYTFLQFNNVFGVNMNAVRDQDLARTQAGQRSYIMAGFATRMRQHHISYAEVSFTWAYLPFIRMLAEQAAQIEAETNGAVVIRLNMGTIRGGHLTSGLENILNNTRMHGTQYLQGVDLVGNESDSPALTAAHPVYRAVHNRNATHPSEVLHLTMHAGEFGAPENPRDAILMGAERIGHAVKLDQDGVTTEYAARNHFPIEANPLSNLRLGVVPSIARHPFLKQLRLGMRVSLSTDDEGIFDTNISQECATVVGGTDITYNELKQMSFNSLETAFLPEERKERLRQQLEHDFVSFEASRSR